MSYAEKIDALIKERDDLRAELAERDAALAMNTMAYANNEFVLQQERKQNEELRAKIAALADATDIPAKYKRMEFNAQLQNENADLRARLTALEGQKPVIAIAELMQLVYDYADAFHYRIDSIGEVDNARLKELKEIQLRIGRELKDQLAKLYAAAGAVPKDMSVAWAEGYTQGVEDERTSEDNIGIAGFGAKVNPARQNPYRSTAAAKDAS